MENPGTPGVDAQSTLSASDALLQLEQLVDRRRQQSPWYQPPAPRRRGTQFGQLLVERGLLTPEELDRALDLQRTTRQRLGELLVDAGIVSRSDVTDVLAEHLGVPSVDLETRVVDPVAAALIPEEIAVRHGALPIERWNGQLVVAMANPNDVVALDDLRVLTGEPILAVLADPDLLATAIARSYHQSDIDSSFDDAVEAADQELLDPVDADGDNAEAAPVIRLVNFLLEQAIKEGASDLHIEPGEKAVRVRMRVDGVLHDVSEAPTAVLRPLVSRLKVLSGLDIAQTRLPQDGRLSVRSNHRAIDVRVATVPTVVGESAVLRLLDPERGVIDLDGLGMSDNDRQRVTTATNASQGALFVVGPTGSGKSSTVYALATGINTRARSIASVEDPVEYRVNGIKQVQINRRAGMTFPNALRAILRADPDAVIVGEVRDAETARIAADASITGHLVLSTLHATRAATTPIRLVDMGVEPYLVASALSCIIAQRLVRTVCESCAETVRESAVSVLRDLGADSSILEADPLIRVARGCFNCHNTGYVGRRGLFEVMTVTEEISRLIVNRASAAEIEHLAVEQGMTTMRCAALQRVAQGELTIEEMLRVIA